MSFLTTLAQSSTQYDQSMYDTSSPYSDSSYYSNSNVDPAAAAAISLATIGFILLFAAVAYVVGALLLSRIFKKAGVEPWKAWVPFYNTWIMLELGDQKGFWAVLMIVPVVNIVASVFMYIAMYRIGLKLGKDGAFVLLAIFLPLVWYIWLAVDSSKWQAAPGSLPQQPAAPSASNPTNQPPTPPQA